jgi:hypothetical protein
MEVEGMLDGTVFRRSLGVWNWEAARKRVRDMEAVGIMRRRHNFQTHQSKNNILKAV